MAFFGPYRFAFHQKEMITEPQNGRYHAIYAEKVREQGFCPALGLFHGVL